MNLLQKAVASVFRLPTTERPLSLTDPDGWPSPHGTDSGVTATPEAVIGLPAVWACVNLLAGTAATLPMMVYRTEKDGSRSVARDHWLYRLVHDSPNSDQTAVDFWEYMYASVELKGNAYADKVMVGSRVVALKPVNPHIMVVDRVLDGRIRYRWTEDGQSFERFDNEVLHIRGFGGNPLGGMSTLSFCRQTFGLSLAINRASAETFKNGLRPSGVLKYNKFLSDPQRDAVEKKLQEKFSGAMNAGRPMLLEGDFDWKQLMLNPEDAQMLESRAFSITEICQIFGVPPFMIGYSEKSTSWGTGLSEQTLGFVKFSLRRRLKRTETAIQKQLLTPDDRAAGIVVEVNIEGLLRGDSKNRADFYSSGLNNGWMTINEVRALENMPPIEGGNVARMQSQNVPITEAGKEPPTALASSGRPLRVVEGGR